MLTLEAISQELQTIKKEHAEFVTGPSQTYENAYNKALKDVIESFQSQKPRIQKLIFQALQQKSHLKDVVSFEQLIDTPTQELEIKLDLINLFRAGYSTNVDLELQEEFKNLPASEVLDIKRENRNPLFQYRGLNGNHIINTDLGELNIETKSKFLKEKVPSKPMFGQRSKLYPLNYMLGEMQQLEYYQKSEKLPDQLAYHFYTHTTNDVDKFLWLGDDHKFCGINGLSVAIAKLLQDYIHTGEDTYDQRMEHYVEDRVAKSPVIQEFNTIFQDYLSIDVESKKGHIIYKLGPKLKQ